MFGDKSKIVKVYQRRLRECETICLIGKKFKLKNKTIQAAEKQRAEAVKALEDLKRLENA